LCHQVLSESARQEIKKKGKLKEGGSEGGLEHEPEAVREEKIKVRTGAPALRDDTLSRSGDEW
jgi:hypothetical protein